MTSRNDNREIGINRTEQYRELLKERNVQQIRQHFTTTLKHLTGKQIAQLQLMKHEWKVGDRYSKLAEQWYSDPTAWWVIAQFNQKPTDAHVQVGDVVYIPLPLEQVLRMFDV